MFLEIPDLLTPSEISRLKAIAGASPFIDGKISNPANKTKDNQQIDMAHQGYRDSSALMLQAFQRCPEFRDFAMPAKIAPPMLCKYGPGQKYGRHSDAAFGVVQGGLLRFDVSSTIFLSPPEACEGGELTITFGARTLKIKGKPGSAVVYPSVTLHEVAPITSGERLVAITFIQSQVRDHVRRELLYQLNEVYALEGNSMNWENRVMLQHVHTSLLRMWME